MASFSLSMSLITCKPFYGVRISDGICLGGIYTYEAVHLWQLSAVWAVEVKN